MVFKDKLGEFSYKIMLTVITVVLSPLFLFILICALLYTPIDYIKFKRSLYHKDFPSKYHMWCGEHPDNELYTLIKEMGLPVEYIKPSNDYDSLGYFLYKDVLLNIDEPLFFDKEKGLFIGKESNSKKNEEISPEECTTVEETMAFCIEEFRNRVPNRECNKIVFFYNAKNAKDFYGKDAVSRMKETEGLIPYDNGKLKEAVLEYIANN